MCMLVHDIFSSTKDCILRNIDKIKLRTELWRRVEEHFVVSEISHGTLLCSPNLHKRDKQSSQPRLWLQSTFGELSLNIWEWKAYLNSQVKIAASKRNVKNCLTPKSRLYFDWTLKQGYHSIPLPRLFLGVFLQLVNHLLKRRAYRASTLEQLC